jgi:predicted RNA binding protein YcfA (HicA-like mRNA interferase family)
MKASEIARKLKAQGWYIYQHGTRHDKWRHNKYKNGKMSILIPRHKSEELSPGVQAEILTAMNEIE